MSRAGVDRPGLGPLDGDLTAEGRFQSGPQGNYFANIRKFVTATASKFNPYQSNETYGCDGCPVVRPHQLRNPELMVGERRTGSILPEKSGRVGAAATIRQIKHRAPDLVRLVSPLPGLNGPRLLAQRDPARCFKRHGKLLQTKTGRNG